MSEIHRYASFLGSHTQRFNPVSIHLDVKIPSRWHRLNDIVL
ncbi:hypothetical protein RB213_013785 [Colletotrichum asianum]